jgi:hypothetical protein
MFKDSKKEGFKEEDSMFLLFKLNETFKKGMGINPFDLTFGSKSF